MKRTISLVVIATIMLILCACGKQQETEQPTAAILASSLISREEGEAILEVALEVTQPDREIPPGASQCAYSTDDDMFLIITVTQNALLSEQHLKFGGAKNIFRELIDFQKEDAPEDMLPAKGIGEEAYYIDLAHTNQWTLHILQSDLMIAVHLSGHGDKDWIIEKLGQLGSLAVGNLK